ncbi:N-acetylmuramic acid 6-phosphate etherase [Lederbergia sp. NSJ-179]|uniref:N-acetylmuramic acid 6-phosphate etherase n=1 Tax=Lederbergia sp. NSJ-179 TaxID=2931402 RepID=UPI001FD20642|nr:N-acetylmuramic acid 6-phosphate etherase [Lederbergia sp. NSJ-179]MCJ7841535.1 N-acetylmuramic acid 6-phosphate etherase [Lederbergia sp. NSJ-179]
MELDLSKLITEQINENSKGIDQMSTQQIVQLMNNEDQKVIEAIQAVIPSIVKATDEIYYALQKGGRLFYIGAGTSGRLGILDAAECPPTFYTTPEMVQGIIAGGNQAVFVAVEGAEDNPEAGKKDLEEKELTPTDIVVGIAASGRTPYVIGALEYARSIGTATIGLTCNKDTPISKVVDHSIEVIVGPEVLTGSTRLKAATAHKMVLNMFTTISMIKMGKVYENLMIDLQPTNSKLVERARTMLMAITGKTFEEAKKALEETNLKVKPAIVMLEAEVSCEEAFVYIDRANGFVREAIQLARQEKR